MNRWTSLICHTLLVSSLFAVPAFAAATPGHWVNGGTKFQLADGSMAQNQWVEDEEGRFYYMGADGAYVTGWQTIQTADKSASYDYYFDKGSGIMYVSRYTPTGYYVNADGVKTPERYLIGSEAASIEAAKRAEAAAGTENTTATAESGQTAAASVSETPTDNAAKQAQATDQTQTAEQSQAAEQTQAAEQSQAAGQTQAAETEQAEEAQLATAFFNMLNDRRLAKQLPAFEKDAALTAAAELRAGEIAAYTADEVASNPGIYYNRPEKHSFGGIQTASSVTAVAEQAIASFTDSRYGVLITELPVWQAENPEDALQQLVDKNESFLLDTTYGFNRMGVGCKKQDGKLYFSVFIGTHANN